MAMEMANNSQNDDISEHDGFFFLLPEGYLDESNDLCCWEMVNSSDAFSDDNEIYGLSLDSSQNGLVVSWHSSQSRSNLEENQTEIDAFDRDQLVGYLEKQVSYQEEDDEEEEGEYKYGDDLDDGDDDDDDGDDVDDELVPWSVSGKLGRQRMRKLGKRAFAKMQYSKKSPFLYLKPGCLHGKHGLGMKHRV